MYSVSSAKKIKTYTHFVDGQAARADDDAQKIVLSVDPNGPFFSRYEMSDSLEALFDLAKPFRETLGEPETSF